MDRYERLQIFYERLAMLPPFQSHDEAFEAMHETLLEVEDEFSGIPRAAEDAPKMKDGRMYPPHISFKRDSGMPNVWLYWQAGHITYISNSGAVLIFNRRQGIIDFQKASASGEEIVL